MLTRLRIRNFKRFTDADIELGQTVVCIGPNNSGKTSALQALALWQIGVRRWLEKRGGKTTPEKRPGITLNRRDLLSMPVPSANLLWHDLHVRSVEKRNGKQDTKNVFIDIIVEGFDGQKTWECGLEFYYANEESFYCRPIRIGRDKRMPVPIEAGSVQVAFLPPMSGLAANETRMDVGAVQVRIGEGRTAEVLRNLCLRVVREFPDEWSELVADIRHLFGVELLPPNYVAERGEVTLNYRSETGKVFDLSSSGRGLQQTLLLLAYLKANPDSVLLLDEPDAHLEILRQRHVYQLLTEVGEVNNNQIIAASHSEILLNEAADRDVLIAFVGKPHRIDDRGTQVAKSLKEIGFDQYYQAEQRGWVLYLEGSTDLAILRAFAKTLNHNAADLLQRPFVHYIGNQLNKANSHFHGLKEAMPQLLGLVILDRQDDPPTPSANLPAHFWSKREIENYLIQLETLLVYAERLAKKQSAGPLFSDDLQDHYRDTMDRCFRRLVPQIALENERDRWWNDVKASEDFLDRLFENFFAELELPNLMRKTDYHFLAALVSERQIDNEIVEVLDRIENVAENATPVVEE